MFDPLNDWAARKGGKLGRELADRHGNKPAVVFAVALIMGGLGGWLAWAAESSSEGAYWFGVGLMVFGAIGIIRGILLTRGKDFA